MKKTVCLPYKEERNPPIMGEKRYPKATDADQMPNVCMVLFGGADLKTYTQIDAFPK